VVAEGEESRRPDITPPLPPLPTSSMTMWVLRQPTTTKTMKKNLPLPQTMEATSGEHKQPHCSPKLQHLLGRKKVQKQLPLVKNCSTNLEKIFIFIL
jgi:hypothetical protein